MVKIIQLGKYNKLYKYILFYLLLRLIHDYIFKETFPKAIRPSFFYDNNYPFSLLVDKFFIFLGSFIFSIFLFFYEKSQQNGQNKNENENNNNSLKNQERIYTKKFYLIHNEKYIKGYTFKKLVVISIISIISFQIINDYNVIGLYGLIFWIFDIFFVATIMNLVFRRPIYLHKKCAILFVLIFSSSFKILSTFEYLYNDKYKFFYKSHIGLIPIIIILYFILSLTRFYSLCKIKYIFDFNYISVSTFFFIYNFIGMIILLIASLIAHFIKCADKDKIKDIDLICLVKIVKENNIEYYYDNFTKYFEQLWKKDISTGINIIYLIIFIIKLILNALMLLYSVLIVKCLSPEYYLISFDIYFFIIRLISLINAIIVGDDLAIEFYQFFAELGAMIGLMIYLELIELKFFRLNENLKVNIELRSISEYEIDKLYE